MLSLKPTEHRNTSKRRIFKNLCWRWKDWIKVLLTSLQRSLVTWLQFLQSHVKHLCSFSGRRLQYLMESRITIFITSVQPVSYLSLYNLPCKADKSLSCRLLASRPDVWIHLVDFAARSKTLPSLKLSFQSSLDVCDWSGNHACL